MTARLRLSEGDARTLVLVQAVEDTDAEGVLLPPLARAAATRRVFDAPAGRAEDDRARLRARARLLGRDLVRTTPALGHLLVPVRAQGPVILAVVAVAAVGGALTSLFGPERHVSVLAFPLAGILLWNLAVYGGLLVQAVARPLLRAHRRGRAPDLSLLGRWLEGAWPARLARRLGGSARSAAVTAAVQRFHQLWLPTAAPLIAARVRIVLHLGAMAAAVGAAVGLYVSGIAFEYRATWESTWLDPPAVQRYLDVALGPAARWLGMDVPDVAPLRGPGGEGDARPWIHLWAATLTLVVVLPRAVLALLAVLTAARLARRLPVPVDDDYARRALHSGRGAATRAEVVYYGCAPDTALRERLHTLVQEEVGARAVIRDAATLEYGDEPGRVPLPEEGRGPGLLVLVFALAQTPEADVHGEFVERLRERLDGTGWALRIVLETATFRRRVGSEDRVRERRATWDRLLRDLQLTAAELA